MSTSDPLASAQAYHDAISARAREIWRDRGSPSGNDVEIWLEAERDLVQRGLIPGAPKATARSTRRVKVAADQIDQNELADRLSKVGDPGARSTTALDPTGP